MEKEVFCSPEEFADKSNEMTQALSNSDEHFISTRYRELADLERINGNKAMSQALKLAGNICSMMLVPESLNEPFQPEMQLADGRRTAIPDDFSKEDLAFIERSYPLIENHWLKARFSDLLWLCRQPRKIEHAKDAIQSYLALPLDPGSWYLGGQKCLERCIVIAKSIRDSEALSQVSMLLLDGFKKEYVEHPYLRLHIARVIEKHGFLDESTGMLADVLFKSAEDFALIHSYEEARNYLGLALRFFQKDRNKEGELLCLSMIAEYYVFEGNLKSETEGVGQMMANYFYEKALQSYRKVPKAYREELDIDASILSVQAKISESGKALIEEMKPIHSFSQNISDLIEDSRKYVQKKRSLEEALVYFASFPAPKYQQQRANAEEILQNSFFSNLFSKTFYAHDGRVVARQEASGLNVSTLDQGDKLLYQAIKSFNQYIQLAAEGQVIPALEQILLEFRVTKGFLQEMCYLSPAVPEGREYLMASALWCGFEYDFSGGIHLLTPQVENLVRVKLKKHGVITTTNSPEGIETENGLSSLLENPESIDILGEDLWFELKAVFGHPLGPNLRNEVAHGLLDDDRSASHGSIYAWWMILRVVVRSLYESQREASAEK